MPIEPLQPDRASDMIEVAVTVERPSSEELAQHSRAEKYKALRENTAGIRERLIAWIKDQGLSEEVSQIGEPTAFNVLFVVSTRRVAEQLARAPGVVSVSLSKEFEVDLPGPVDKHDARSPTLPARGE